VGALGRVAFEPDDCRDMVGEAMEAVERLRHRLGSGNDGNERRRGTAESGCIASRRGPLLALPACRPAPIWVRAKVCADAREPTQSK
jgi:hypothetical protein